MKPQKITTLVWLLAFVLLSGSAGAAIKDGRLTAPVALATPARESGVRLALQDLARDCRVVLGGTAEVRENGAAEITVRIDPALPSPESWRIDIDPAGVRITGSDELGAIYGIYQFSEKFLGTDPFGFWKDRVPEKKASVSLAPQQLKSSPPAFRWRGWFVNDEDLLTEWKKSGGPRFIDYPFYFQVINPRTADRIFETLLRAGGNLVIPASFVDVMNPPEAALVSHAARRGLHVTQHHIEPLGVSHFGYENYWKRRGETIGMSYATQPDKVRETWRAYAAKWRELAGDKVVWQLGLRGRGDRPVWTADKNVKPAEAGALISRAIADQWAIVREADPRPLPPATTTLWAEGSELMRQGSLAFPQGVTIVFADEGKSQTMQEDFRNAAREPGRAYGVYYHVAYWSNGPHLVQGTRPEKLKRVFDEVIGKGDTGYAIVNVSNIREHVLGVQAASEVMRRGKAWDPAEFMTRFAPPALRPVYRDFLNSFVELNPDCVLQDGFLYAMTGELRRALASRKTPSSATIALHEKLRASTDKLDKIIRDYPADSLQPAERDFYDVNLLTQARMLRGLYRYCDELILAAKDRGHLKQAAAALEEVLELRRRAEQGPWENWYRGDKKMNLPRWLEETRKLIGESHD